MEIGFHIPGLMVLSVAIIIVLAVTLTKEKGVAGPVTLEVHDLSGAIEVTQLHAPRLPDLHGKTICELSNRRWEDDRTFPAIRELLQRQFPTAKIIPYTEFPGPYTAPEVADRVDSPEAADLIVKRGCEAVIVGNAA